MQSLIPFAVIGSEKSIVVGGKQVRGRQNRWGVINGTYKPLPSHFNPLPSPKPQQNPPLTNIAPVEDENHCEFIYLRNFLTRTHLQDLIETTSQIHYESFRAKQLLALKESSAAQGSRPISPAADRELSRNSQRVTMNGY